MDIDRSLYEMYISEQNMLGNECKSIFIRIQDFEIERLGLRSYVMVRQNEQK